MKQRKTILLIGGAGYIGSHVNKMLFRQGYATVVFDNQSTGNQLAVVAGEYVDGDVNSSYDLATLFNRRQFDGVMHFAAKTDVGESVVDPLSYYKNNVCGTLNLLSYMKMYGIDSFVFSSSAAVYGLPKRDKVSEEDPCRPINPYGHSKWMVEQILADSSSAYGLRSVSLRYFNAAGGDPEGEVGFYRTHPSNLIPRVLCGLARGERGVTLFGNDYPTSDGTCVRDYIHVQDLAHAHILSLEYLFSGGESTVYNLGNGEGFTVREVFAAIEEVTGKKLEIIEGARREGDPPILVANALRAKKDLDWTPGYSSLCEMIAHAWQVIAK